MTDTKDKIDGLIAPKFLLTRKLSKTTPPTQHLPNNVTKLQYFDAIINSEQKCVRRFKNNSFDEKLYVFVLYFQNLHFEVFLLPFRKFKPWGYFWSASLKCSPTRPNWALIPDWKWNDGESLDVKFLKCRIHGRGRWIRLSGLFWKPGQYVGAACISSRKHFLTLCASPLNFCLIYLWKKQLSVFWNPALRVAMFVFPFVTWWRLFRKCEVYAQCDTLSLQYIGHSYLYRSDSEGLKK